MPQLQQADKWEQYATPTPPPAPSGDRWAQFADSVTSESSETPDAPDGAPVPPLRPSHAAAESVDRERLGMALVNSHMLGVPASFAYQNHDLINEQFKQRGADMPKSTNTIAKDIEVGLQSTISGLLQRNKLPDELKDPTRRDKIISGLAQMIGDLPFYGMGALAGTAFGTVAG